MRLQFNKQAPIAELPDAYQGVEFIKLALREGGQALPGTAISALISEIKNDPKLSLFVPSKLTNPDKLIISAKERLLNKDLFGRYYFPGMIRCMQDELDIRVAKKNISRVLLFADTLIKALRGRGHEIVFRDRSTYVSVKGQEFRICLREKTKRVPIPGSGECEYRPTDLLYFKYDGYSSKQWTDGRERIETYLPEILAKLEIAADQLTAEQERQQRHFDELARQRQLVKDRQERKQKELADFILLLGRADRWQKTMNLRSYIDAIEARANKTDLSGEVKKWIRWSRSKADWYDPFIEAEDKLLDDVDRTTLAFPEAGRDYG